MESNHCFHCPLHLPSLLLPLQPSGYAASTPHTSRPSWCNLLYSVESEDIKKAITINIRLYSSLWPCIYQSFSDSSTCPFLPPTVPPHNLSTYFMSCGGLTAGTHAALIKGGDSQSETQERWSGGKGRERWSEESCS